MASTSRILCGLAVAILILQAFTLVVAQSQDLIVDICTTPNKYWNKQVLLKGHVVKVTPDPPGTNRGRYTLRDQSDKDLEVATEDLPAQGKVYIINGVVEQRRPGDSVPVVREGNRSPAQPDTPVAASAPAASVSSSRPQASAGRASSKAEIEEVVRKELEKAKAQSAGASMAVTPTAAPASAPVAATAPIMPVAPAPPVPGLFENPLVIGIILVAVVAIIGVIGVSVRNKSAAPGYPAAPQPRAATMAAGRATEVVTRLGGELSVVEGPDRGRSHVITKPATTIGRPGQRKNDMELSDAGVSREQAKVLYSHADRTFKLVNESPTNPTRVNASAVDAVVLQDGDRIEFGNTAVRFKKT